MSRSVVRGTGGHVVPSLGRGPVHLNTAVSIAVLFELLGDVTAFRTTDEQLGCYSRWAAAWMLFAMAGRRVQTLTRGRGPAAQRNTDSGLVWVIGGTQHDLWSARWKKRHINLSTLCRSEWKWALYVLRAWQTWLDLFMMMRYNVCRLFFFAHKKILVWGWKRDIYVFC